VFVATIWFAILAGLLIGYAILDGFDLGVGAVHLLLARTDRERRVVLGAIGPVWDGNEVWLIAWGAALLLAFPRAYAAGFSGFYLPLMIALWLLMGRGVAIEFRHHIADPLWHGACDTVFSISSLLLIILYGVAVGNVVSGVPLNDQGYFQGLFEWMLNPYALLMGAFSLAILVVHGTHYLTVKAEGALQERAHRLARSLWGPTVVLAVSLTAATFAVRPELLQRFRALPILLALPLLGATCFLLMRWAYRHQAYLWSFACSSGVIFALLASTAAGLYPYLLPSRPDLARSLTVENAAAPLGSLTPALIWMIPGVILLAAYQVVVYRTFKGKVAPEASAHY
jgi:cytochrome d ubiquinol oxidase subunit II